MKMLNIRVCVPYYPAMTDYPAKAGLEELRQCNNINFEVVERPGTYIWEIRNSLINDERSHLIHQKPLPRDYFLDIDTDIYFTLGDIMLMIERDKDCITLPYLVHGSNCTYQCGWWGSKPGLIGGKFTTREKGCKIINWSGNGMRLTKAHVYADMEYPWYYHPMIESGACRKEAGEDIGFSMNIAKAGYEVWCDFYNPVKHKQRNQNGIKPEIESTVEL